MWNEMKGRKKEMEKKKQIDIDIDWLVDYCLSLDALTKLDTYKKFEKKRDTNSREREKGEGKNGK